MSARGEKFIKVCPQCGSEFECMKSNEKTYCSRECANKSRQTGTNIQCDNCGKTFHRRQYHIDRQKKKGQNNFCCAKCQKEYLHKQTYEIRICEICGNEFEVSKLSTQRFCSYDCQNKWQSMQTGELNPNFLSILTPCTYCGKNHYVKPYKFNEQEHFFCSKECRQAWYANIFSQSDEWRNKSQQRAIEQLSSGNINTETLPQQKVDEILNTLHIQYKREALYEYYTVDNYLSQYNLIIEVQGDYWHTNANIFQSTINTMQYTRIGKDKAKHSYFKNQYGIEILYLWEYDVINNPELCRYIIQEYINNNGKLSNYHSFNYSLKDDSLILNDDIIIPYQDMSLDQYTNMLHVAI